MTQWRWIRTCGAVSALVVAAVLGGCKDAAQVEMKMSVAPRTASSASDDAVLPEGNFFTNGFPTDLRIKSDGKVDISDFPRRIHFLTNAYVRSIDREVGGYSPLLPVYIPFTAPILTDLLPQNPMDFTAADAPIQLIDVDVDSPEYGRRFPLTVKMTRSLDQYRPDNLLQVLPMLGMTLRGDTTYALIVTNAVPVDADKTVLQNDQLQALLNPQAGTAPVSERALTVYAPLRDYLAQAGIASDTVIGATVWTTANLKTRLKTSSAHVAQMPVAAPQGLYLEEEYEDYCVIGGTVEVPGFQRGPVPYVLTGGDVEFTAAGAPIQQYTRTSNFVVTIPKHTPMPEAGFPIVNYHHGAGGRANQVYMRGEHLRLSYRALVPVSILNHGNGPSRMATERGWASSGLSGHMGMEHLGIEGGGFGFFGYNVFNPVAFKYTYYQMVWERVYFRRFLNSLRLDASLCPGAIAPADNTFRIDPDMQVSMGQSLGNWTSSLQIAADPEPFQGAIFSGVAGSWLLMFIDSSAKKLAFENTVATVMPGTHVDMYHPFVALLGWMMSDVDPLLYMDELYRYPTRPSPHSLLISGIDDSGSPEFTQRTFMIALGADFAGPEVGATPDTDIRGYLTNSGAQAHDYPVSGNLQLPGQSPRTAVVTRYENTVRPSHNGHHVTYDLPAVKHQYGCFLQNLSEGRAPVIIEGTVQGGPCL